MESDWIEMPLEEAMDAIIDYRGKTPTKTTSGIPLITAKIVKNGRINPTQEYIAESDYDSWMQRGIPQKGDVVLTTEAPLGEVAQLDGSKIALAQRIITLRGKAGLLESDFLKYLLQSNDVRHQLDGRATGTTVSGIKQSELRQVLLSFPPLPEQKAIAHILGTLDDKIELNRRMNATLEGMAQALFKSWFVDFDPVIDNALAAGNPIPDELAARAEVRRQALANGTANHEAAKAFPAAFQETEELGWIPEGWEVRQLDELIKLIGGGTPKTSVEEYWNGEIPWFSVVDAPNDSDVFVIDTEKKITEKGLNNSSTKLLRSGTTIISARGTVGRCALVGVEMTMNQSCYGIQGEGGASDSYTYYSIRHYVSDLQQRGHGSVFNTITRDTFRSIKVPFGGSELTEAFEDHVTGLLARIKGNLQEQTTLTKVRDTLLPKIISGELNISTDSINPSSKMPLTGRPNQRQL